MKLLIVLHLYNRHTKVQSFVSMLYDGNNLKKTLHYHEMNFNLLYFKSSYFSDRFILSEYFNNAFNN